MGSVGRGVVDVEIVETAGRAVAAELADIDLASDARFLQQRVQFFAMLVLELFLDAVGAQTLYFAAHEEPRLVNGIAERLAGITEDNQRAGLRHEGAHMTDRASDHDISALERDAATRGCAAVDDQ